MFTGPILNSLGFRRVSISGIGCLYLAAVGVQINSPAAHFDGYLVHHLNSESTFCLSRALIIITD